MNEHTVVNGTFYDVGTDPEVIQVLERARESRTRLAVVYEPESSIQFGRVGRSVGPVKVPLLVHNSRSLGGEPICTRIVTEIRESAGGRVLYRKAS